MPAYSEFPFERIVNVRWKKKGPPDGGGGPAEPEPCGQFEYPGVMPFLGVSRWSLDGQYQPYMIGLANTIGSLAQDGDGNFYFLPYNSFIPISHGEMAPDLYYWGYGSGISGFTITYQTVPTWFDRIGVDIYHNLDAANITAASPPDEIIETGESTLSFFYDTQHVSRFPILSFWGYWSYPTGYYFGRDQVIPDDGGKTFLTIQSYCKHQTIGAPPPQPKTHPPYPPFEQGGNGWAPATRYPPSPPQNPPQGTRPPQPMSASRAPILGSPALVGLDAIPRRPAIWVMDRMGNVVKWT